MSVDKAEFRNLLRNGRPTGENRFESQNLWISDRQAASEFSYNCKQHASAMHIHCMRKPRVLQKDALYHVTTRADHKAMILDKGPIKDLLLDTIKRAKEKYDFKTDNFCIMGNHLHLMIKPWKDESLSAIMQWILSVFAMAYNRKMGTTGHVWGSRFFSRIVSGMREFLEVFAYIDENPVKANLVRNPRDWRHGGLWHDRAGLKDIIGEVCPLVRMLFPEHGVLLLGGR